MIVASTHSIVADSRVPLTIRHDLGITTVTGIPSRSAYANHIKKLAGDLNEAPINTIKNMTGIHDSMHYDEFNVSVIRQEP